MPIAAKPFRYGFAFSTRPHVLAALCAGEQMKLRVRNSENKDIVVILEPWATEFVVVPDDYIEFISDAEIPSGAHWLTEYHQGNIVVWPEWEGAIVSTYDSTGKLID